jgi:hypothetical protein
MAIGGLFEFPGVTESQYDGVCRKLSNGQVLSSLLDWPKGGILSHVAGPSEAGWRVVDAWESQAAFEEFGTQLVPLMQEMKFPQVAPQIFAVHNFVGSHRASGRMDRPEKSPSELADRVRVALADLNPSEQKMFGGVCFI